ncbi:hypothetical protein MKK75_34955 [Methylobacterium sp. J-030]|uniref:glycosyltransferase n=1 Tax=Methylobacterium sp. J-030 TaxID=2836627 RepID=UPI001FBA20D7|nr:hypothetical protein [Methylobacterium sp. J-030]MCJ2073933.1 hypothetical protein [Methylobacterium sp. J-030]
MRVPLSCGIPTITSRSSIFSDLTGICHQIDTHETVSAADHIEDLVSDAGKRKKLIDKQSDYINFSTWGNHSSRMIGILDGGHSKNTAASAHILNQKTIPLEQISI